MPCVADSILAMAPRVVLTPVCGLLPAPSGACARVLAQSANMPDVSNKFIFITLNGLGEVYCGFCSAMVFIDVSDDGNGHMYRPSVGATVGEVFDGDTLPGSGC